MTSEGGQYSARFVTSPGFFHLFALAGDLQVQDAIV